MPTHKTLVQALASIDNRLREGFSIAIDTNTEDLRRLYITAVSNWKDKPVFAKEVEESKDGIIGRVAIKSGQSSIDHWFWTDKGTRAHIIRAKNAPTLSFRLGYQAKTAPIAQGNAGSGKSSGQHVKPLVVLHPGTEARKFTETWAKKQRPLILQALRAQVKRVSR